MTQFDQTTEKKAEENAAKYLTDEYASLRKSNFAVGRNSTKASMEILARTVELIANQTLSSQISPMHESQKAIDQVKANGDWPLEEE